MRVEGGEFLLDDGQQGQQGRVGLLQGGEEGEEVGRG